MSDGTQIGCDYWYLEFRRGTSDKFYEAYATDDGVTILRWGRRNAIGTGSASKWRNADEARTKALEKVFQKKAKGYVEKKAHRFLATKEAIDRALNATSNEDRSLLASQAQVSQALATRDTVLQNYAEFNNRVQDLLDRAAEGDVLTIVNELDEIDGIWKEIESHHAEVSIALQVARATLAQRLFGAPA